jgi:hypothetical protein
MNITGMVKYYAKPSQNQSLSWNKIVLQQNCDSSIIIFLVQIMRDLSKFKDQIKKGRV